MMVVERICKTYAHDYMPCDCVRPWSQVKGINVGTVKCIHLDGMRSYPDRGRVWCTCMTCERSWRESPVPIRDYHGGLIRGVDARPFEETTA